MPSGTEECPEAEDHGKFESSPSTPETSLVAEYRDDTGQGRGLERSSLRFRPRSASGGSWYGT